MSAPVRVAARWADCPECGRPAGLTDRGKLVRHRDHTGNPCYGNSPAAKRFCPECRRAAPIRSDGAYAVHRARSGRCCRLSGKTTPDWLDALAAGWSTGQLTWTADQAAEHLGLAPSTAREYLRLAGAQPVGRTVDRQRLYNRLDVQELVARRQQESVPAAAAAELRALYAHARTVNGETPHDSPDRAATVELSYRLAALKHAGATWPQLDAALGARPGTTRRRLVRHGLHGALPPSVQPYRGSTRGNRSISPDDEVPGSRPV